MHEFYESPQYNCLQLKMTARLNIEFEALRPKVLTQP